jgi:hypothetical protein
VARSCSSGGQPCSLGDREPGGPTVALGRILPRMAEPRSDPDPLASPYLDLDTIRRIVTMDDVLARNAAITRGYHALSEAVAVVIGRDHANWLTFGQWASAEARNSIDEEAVPAIVRPFFGRQVSDAVAAGNAAIFGDVAPPFIRFVRLAAAEPPGGRTPAWAEAMMAKLARDPQLAASEDLRRAFRAYLDAIALADAGGGHLPEPSAEKRRAEQRRAARVLVANASIGAHEQLVADPFVKAAIPGRWIVAISATSHMGILVPDGALRLDRDVPPPAYLSGAQFPPALETLDDPEALALANRFGQDPDSAADSDAPNWESYAERMGYIFTLLRVYQQDPALFPLPPGTPEVALP